MSGQSPSPLNHDDLMSMLWNLPPFRLYTVLEDGITIDETNPLVIYGSQVAERLLVLDNRLSYDTSMVNAEIGSWGMRKAQAQRVWNVRARQTRIWKVRQAIKLREQHEKAKEKPPTVAQVEEHYRSAPDYGAVEGREDAAQETFLRLEAIHEAFREKARTLQRDTYKARDGSLQRIHY